MILRPMELAKLQQKANNFMATASPFCYNDRRGRTIRAYVGNYLSIHGLAIWYSWVDKLIAGWYNHIIMGGQAFKIAASGKDDVYIW